RRERREIDAGDANEPLGDQRAVLVLPHREIVPQAARVFERAGDADAKRLTGAHRCAVARVRLHAGHPERVFVEQRLSCAPERDHVQLLLGILEPAEKVREPRYAGWITIRPVDLLEHLEQPHHTSIEDAPAPSWAAQERLD